MKSRILVVEDERIISENIQQILIQLGYEVVDAVDKGEMALEVAREKRPDLVLMDIVLKGQMDGIEAAGAIRNETGIPVIYLTAYANESILQRARITEPFGYLLKPFRKQELRMAIETSLYKDKLERELRISETRHRELAHLLPQVVFEMDSDGHITFANQSAKSTFEIDEDFRESGFLVTSFVAPEETERLRSDIERVLSGETVHEVQYTAMSEAGRRFPTLMYAGPIISDGQVMGLRGVLVDISELKRHEKALKDINEELEKRVQERTVELRETNDKLREEIQQRKEAEDAAKKSEELFRVIFESARDSIFVKDTDLKYTLVNPEMERTFGMDAESMRGKTDWELYGARPAKRLTEVDKRVLNGATVEEERSRVVNSATLTFHEIKAPIRDLQGNVTGLCGISRNVTDRKRIMNVNGVAPAQSRSKAMKETLKEASQAAATGSMVLLLGESGSGKDYLAKWIHENSDRSDGPFFTMNCAALNPDLAEAELFGHEAGAFTGAKGRVRGLLELAEGGTLLLNEIGELSAPLQAKLLTFLDSREFVRVGGRKSISVNARLIAATNRDLKKAVQEGLFRNDLYFRINVLTINVPPLRDRKEDIEDLAVFILSRLAGELQLNSVPQISGTGLKRLMEYTWPGNVRELRNVLERALIVSGGDALDFEELESVDDTVADWTWKIDFPPNAPLPDLIKNMREELVEEALRRTGGHKQDAAKLLGISRYTLHRYLS